MILDMGSHTLQIVYLLQKHPIVLQFPVPIAHLMMKTLQGEVVIFLWGLDYP